MENSGAARASGSSCGTPIGHISLFRFDARLEHGPHEILISLVGVGSPFLPNTFYSVALIVLVFFLTLGPGWVCAIVPCIIGSILIDISREAREDESIPPFRSDLHDLSRVPFGPVVAARRTLKSNQNLRFFLLVSRRHGMPVLSVCLSVCVYLSVVVIFFVRLETFRLYITRIFLCSVCFVFFVCFFKVTPQVVLAVTRLNFIPIVYPNALVSGTVSQFL